MRDVKSLGNVRNTDSTDLFGGWCSREAKQILAALQNPPDPNSLASHPVATGSMLVSINFLKEI